MPRKSRCHLPGVPCHVVQRGNDRSACFFEDENYQYYLHCLAQAAERYAVAVHAYVLMTNHVHLLLTPQSVHGVSRLMQLLGNRYVQYINKKYGRTGTLWEGRYKLSLVMSEAYVLTCYRYIELNPVRAGMVSHPADYRWSSYRLHARGGGGSFVCDHDVYDRLGAASAERGEQYRGLFETALDEVELKTIRTATAFSGPLGNERFKDQIEVMRGREVRPSGRGCQGSGQGVDARQNLNENDF